MNYKFCPKRRLFLSQASLSLGLVSATSLFNLKSHAQAVKVKKNVIFMFFYNGANIPFGGRDDRGGFQLKNDLSGLNQRARECLFIRNVHCKFKGNNNAHSVNQAAAFSGHANGGKGDNQSQDLKSVGNGPYDGTSVDIVAGGLLKEKFGAVKSHLNLGYAQNQADGKTHKNTWKWKTGTFRDKDTADFPNTNPNNAFKLIDNGVTCNGTQNNNNNNNNNNNQVNNYEVKKEVSKLRAIKESLKQYNSRYLISKKEMEILERDVSSKLEAAEAKLDGTTSPPSRVIASGNCKKMSFNSKYGAGGSKNSDNEFKGKSNDFYDLMVYALQGDYTRSITYYCNIFQNKAHGDAHQPIRANNIVANHNKTISESIASLIKKLEDGGIYEDTMIVLTGEFPHQAEGNKTMQHRSDRLPWLIINSGKSGEYNSGGKNLHPGDVHCNILNRLGFAVNKFGGNNWESGNRSGNFDKKFLV